MRQDKKARVEAKSFIQIAEDLLVKEQALQTEAQAGLQEISISGAASLIQKALDADVTNVDLKRYYDWWLRVERTAAERNVNWTEVISQSPFGTTFNTNREVYNILSAIIASCLHKGEGDYAAYADYLKPGGFLYEDLIKKIRGRDSYLPSLMMSTIAYFDRVSKLPAHQQKDLLAQFPTMTKEEYDSCVGGTQYRMSTVTLQIADPVAQAFNNIVSQKYTDLLRFVDYSGNHAHLPSVIQVYLGFNPIDSGLGVEMLHWFSERLPAQQVWNLVRNFDYDLKRKFDRIKEEDKAVIIAIAEAFDKYDKENPEIWKNKIKIHCDKLGIKEEELYGAFLNGDLELKTEVVQEKLGELVKKFDFRTIKSEIPLDFNLYDKDAPQKIAAILKDLSPEMSDKRQLAFRALWILSKDFPGNSKANFLKTIIAFASDEVIENFHELSDEKIQLLSDKFLSDKKMMSGIWGVIRESYLRIIKTPSYPFYDVIEENPEKMFTKDGVFYWYINVPSEQRNKDNKPFIQFLSRLATNHSDDIFYHPERDKIVSDIVKYYKELHAYDQEKPSIWNGLFEIAAQKQDVQFLTQVIAEGKKVGLNSYYSESVLTALATSIGEQNKEMLKIVMEKVVIRSDILHSLITNKNKADFPDNHPEASLKVAEFLIRTVADTSLIDRAGNGLFHLAILHDKSYLLPLFLGSERAITNLNKPNNAGQTPLMMAFEKQDQKSSKMIFEKLTPAEQIAALNELTFTKEHQAIGEEFVRIIGAQLDKDKELYAPSTNPNPQSVKALEGNKKPLESDLMDTLTKKSGEIPSATALVARIRALQETSTVQTL